MSDLFVIVVVVDGVVESEDKSNIPLPEVWVNAESNAESTGSMQDGQVNERRSQSLKEVKIDVKWIMTEKLQKYKENIRNRGIYICGKSQIRNLKLGYYSNF